MDRIDVGKLRECLLDYYGTAAFGGFPAAIIDAIEIESMSDKELIEKAISLGVDIRRFVVE